MVVTSVALAGHAARLRERIEAARQARAAFAGDCRHCLDRGPCGRCERGRREAARTRAAAAAEIARALPARLRGLTLAGHPNARAAEWARRFLDGWDGQAGLFVTGGVGVGKTGLLAGMALAVAPRLAEERRTLRFAFTPDLLDELRAGMDAGGATAVMRAYQTAGLLILDDLGSEHVVRADGRPSPWAQERLLALVNYRYEHRLPLWASSNQRLSDLAATLGERTVDRLREVCWQRGMSGASLRGKAGA